MLSFPASLRIYLATAPCDMRKSFNGLHALTQSVLKEDPCQGALFVFTNQRRTHLKILYYDGTGLWVLAKRLEKGTFCWPRSNDADSCKISLAPEALSALIGGIDLNKTCPRAWYQRDT